MARPKNKIELVTLAKKNYSKLLDYIEGFSQGEPI